MIKARVHEISSTSHLTYHNGEPCNKYTATVKLGIVNTPGWAGTWFLCVYARTERALDRKLCRFRTDAVLELSEQELNNMYHGGRGYGWKN